MVCRLRKTTRTLNTTLQHMAGDTELGVGGGPGSRQMGLCQQNPRLSTPTFFFSPAGAHSLCLIVVGATVVSPVGPPNSKVRQCYFGHLSPGEPHGVWGRDDRTWGHQGWPSSFRMSLPSPCWMIGPKDLGPRGQWIPRKWDRKASWPPAAPRAGGRWELEPVFLLQELLPGQTPQR